jgi:primosomal replication protein N
VKPVEKNKEKQESPAGLKILKMLAQKESQEQKRA